MFMGSNLLGSSFLHVLRIPFGFCPASLLFVLFFRLLFRFSCFFASPLFELVCLPLHFFLPVHFLFCFPASLRRLPTMGIILLLLMVMLLYLPLMMTMVALMILLVMLQVKLMMLWHHPSITNNSRFAALARRRSPTLVCRSCV